MEYIADKWILVPMLLFYYFANFVGCGGLEKGKYPFKSRISGLKQITLELWRKSMGADC